MLRIIYKIIYTGGFILTWPFWLIRDMVQHKPYTFKTRFFGPGQILPKQKGYPRVWVWALSLGEVLAAKMIVPALEQTGAEVVISSTTAIGRETATRIFPGRLILASPLDFDFSTRRFLDSVNPDLLLLLETDIWPGILFHLVDRNLPKVLVSARISPKSLQGYGYIKKFWGRVLRLFDLITTQSPADRNALLLLGADPETTLVIGDLKFDRKVSDEEPKDRATLLAETGWPEGRWIVAGSTHTGENEIILDAFNYLKEKAKKKYADLRLLLAPRNKSDFSSVCSLISNRGFPVARRHEPAPNDREKSIFVLDTLGELDRFYNLADIALIGKSWPGLHKGGGHNPLEAAAKGKPIIFGSLTYNYRWMTQALLQANAALEAPDQKALATVLENLLEHPDKALEMGRQAANFVRLHQGSVEKTLTLLRPFLK